MIKLNEAIKNYGDYKLNITMNIPAGQVTGLVGKNGAGKTTAIKLLLGLISVDSGTVETLGKNISDFSAKDKEDIGVAMAEALFYNGLNASDANKILKRLYKNHDANFFLGKCQDLGIPLKQSIKTYSTGMQAKLRVLIAMSHKAKLLILDEPTAGLDVESRLIILDMIRDYVAEDDQRTVLITSHISSDLESLCDDIYLIHDGKVIIHEETDVILDNYGVLKVDEALYETLDKEYLLKTKKTDYGYACFTNEKQFYQENYPEITIEKGNIDDLILMMTGGYR